MRLHVVSLPHTNTTREFSACAYTDKVRKFCSVMSDRGHEIFLYGGEKNEARCTEHVSCSTEKERVTALCGAEHYVHAPFDPALPHWQKFNATAVDAIRQRTQPQDLLCLIAGRCQNAIADALPHLTTVEFGVGYSGFFAKFRSWESYAWMHACYGWQSKDPMSADGQWYDAVIPGLVETEQFPKSPTGPKDYFLFIGRLTERKGPSIAADVCRRMGVKLMVAGQGTPPLYGDYVGVVGPEQRAKLMSEARAVFMPTVYIEPFGNVAVEAMTCGTPVICTDWGAMTETVKQGETGFRCRSLAEFCDAVKHVDELDRASIRRYAIRNYSAETVGGMYEKYFDRLQTLWGEGWYANADAA